MNFRIKFFRNPCFYVIIHSAFAYAKKGGLTELKDDRQHKTPFFSKLKEYGQSNVVPFDVPGHKLGKIKNDLLDFVGVNTFLIDSNAPLGLDTLSKPHGVIKEAEKLMAEACHADRSYFLTNGTTTGILAMIMATCRANDKIILPRNVHKSVISALILSGAMPIFVKPDIDIELGIANGVPYETYEEAIREHYDAKALFIINPTYFGVASDMARLTELAHEFDMVVLADEAHGAQFYFSDKLPLSAMDAGADISATSIHKTAGSFTQSSVLLTKGKRVDHVRLRSTLNMLQSTSPSALLLASLDVARKSMYFDGPKKIDKLLEMARKTRMNLRTISGIKVIDKDYIVTRGGFDFDETKIVIKVSDLGLSGFEVYKKLRRNHNIQLELAESHIVLAVLTIGTTKEDLDRLFEAFKELSKKYYKVRSRLPKIKFIYQFPEPYARPRDAFHAPKLQVPLEEAYDEIAAESIMIYPPGIPFVIPGEIITQEVIDDIHYYLKKGSIIHSDLDNGYVKIIDKEHWVKWEGDSDEF
ncbi:MAG: aminotransferase class I/II-fold pyridoxal phosphate-dependent enzyme [Acholeplasmataceae bacterium]|nr:aminotransferase class I/II-fold pyridoxal phosphate-dependent enzyme [Acholeplasmataceae bacterium]